MQVREISDVWWRGKIKKIILHSFQQMSVLYCRVQRPVFRGVSGCLEKYVLVEGLAKLAGPNMDIVDVFCFVFFPPGSQTRPSSMQWFPFRYFGSHVTQLHSWNLLYPHFDFYVGLLLVKIRFDREPFSFPPQVLKKGKLLKLSSPLQKGAECVKRMVRGARHNELSCPNELHIWLFECFGLMQGQATQWRRGNWSHVFNWECPSTSHPLALSLQSDQEDVYLVNLGVCMEPSNPVIWSRDVAWSSLSLNYFRPVSKPTSFKKGPFIPKKKKKKKKALRFVVL